MLVMPSKIIECQQGTPEWHQARICRVTSSRVADMMARTKTGWGASRTNYEAQLIAEHYRGSVAEPGFQSKEMLWGNETQPKAEKAYNLLYDCKVEPIGFVSMNDFMAGASPDGLVGNDGLVEFKCPNTATHIETLLNESIPGKYLDQMQWQMFCTGRTWCDYVSYDPRIEPHLQMYVKRVHRNEKGIIELVTGAREFLATMRAKIAEIDRKYPRRIAA